MAPPSCRPRLVIPLFEYLHDAGRDAAPLLGRVRNRNMRPQDFGAPNPHPLADRGAPPALVLPRPLPIVHASPPRIHVYQDLHLMASTLAAAAPGGSRSPPG